MRNWTSVSQNPWDELVSRSLSSYCNTNYQIGAQFVVNCFTSLQVCWFLKVLIVLSLSFVLTCDSSFALWIPVQCFFLIEVCFPNAWQIQVCLEKSYDICTWSVFSRVPHLLWHQTVDVQFVKPIFIYEGL